MRKGAQGGNTGGVEYSPGRKKRAAAARRRQEQQWAAKAGPVEITVRADSTCVQCGRRTVWAADGTAPLCVGCRGVV